jgi:hypothetical protein
MNAEKHGSSKSESMKSHRPAISPFHPRPSVSIRVQKALTRMNAENTDQAKANR